MFIKKCPRLIRQTLTRTGTEAGPPEAAGKDVSSVVKSIDDKLAAVGVVAEKVKTYCNGCPSVSFSKPTFTNIMLSLHPLAVVKLIYYYGVSPILIYEPLVKYTLVYQIHVIIWGQTRLEFTVWNDQNSLRTNAVDYTGKKVNGLHLGNTNLN